MASREQKFETMLSPDLWKHIFTFLQEGVGGEEDMRFGKAQSYFNGQAGFYRLRTVSKTFNSIFASHLELSRGLTLSESFPSKSLPSLLAWIGRHSIVVQSFAAYCSSPCLNSVLGALVCFDASAEYALLSQCSDSAMHLLSRCSSLTKCQLTSPCPLVLDISSSQQHPKLQQLVLDDANFVTTPSMG